MNRMWKGQAFTVSHAGEGTFEGRGLIEITSPAEFETQSAELPA
jgi:hypothetical protein